MECKLNTLIGYYSFNGIINNGILLYTTTKRQCHISATHTYGTELRSRNLASIKPGIF